MTIKPLFALGQLAATPGATKAASREYINACLTRHMCGDWGVMAPEDKATNDKAVREHYRIMSAYPIDPTKPCEGHGDNTLWVITEWDRSVTTVLLPEEY